jgi:anti-sigma regulatory factor (Ser/Thr protein kinase)
VATEPAANAIRHGDGGGRLRLWRVGDALHREVTDNGLGIVNPDQASAQQVSVKSGGGRSLLIIRQFSSEVTIAGDLRGTRVTAVLHLSRPA